MEYDVAVRRISPCSAALVIGWTKNDDKFDLALLASNACGCCVRPTYHEVVMKSVDKFTILHLPQVYSLTFTKELKERMDWITGSIKQLVRKHRYI